MTEEFWYRVQETFYSGGVDEYDNPIGGGPVGVRLNKHRVLKTTPKGVWVSDYYGRKRFVLRGANKRYATPSPAEAWESFIARKRRQISILKAQARDAEFALRAAHLAQQDNVESYMLSRTSSLAFMDFSR
jgi:hypothetical protein